MPACHDHKRPILALAPWICPLQKFNGLQVPRQQQRWFVLSRQSQLWKRGSRRSTMVNSDPTMRCRWIGHTSRSIHPPVRSNSKFLRRSIRLSMLACNSHLREKLKSPKPSLREDISPPRYTANNEKCSESQSSSASGALCLAPFRTLTHALPVFMQVIYLPSDFKNFRISRLHWAFRPLLVRNIRLVRSGYFLSGYLSG